MGGDLFPLWYQKKLIIYVVQILFMIPNLLKNFSPEPRYVTSLSGAADLMEP